MFFYIFFYIYLRKKLLFTLELKIENFGIHENSNPKFYKISKKFLNFPNCYSFFIKLL